MALTDCFFNHLVLLRKTSFKVSKEFPVCPFEQHRLEYRTTVHDKKLIKNVK